MEKRSGRRTFPCYELELNVACEWKKRMLQN